MHKKYSRSFVKLHWTTDVTWTVLTKSFLPFWALNVSVVLLSMEEQKALGFHQKYLNLCTEDERRFYRFGMIWGWVINDWFFWWTIPLKYLFIIIILLSVFFSFIFFVCSLSLSSWPELTGQKRLCLNSQKHHNKIEVTMMNETRNTCKTSFLFCDYIKTTA